MSDCLESHDRASESTYTYIGCVSYVKESKQESWRRTKMLVFPRGLVLDGEGATTTTCHYEKVRKEQQPRVTQECHRGLKLKLSSLGWSFDSRSLEVEQPVAQMSGIAAVGSSLRACQ